MSADDDPRERVGAVAASAAGDTWTPPASEASVVEDPVPVADKAPTFEVSAPAARVETPPGDTDSGPDLAATVDEKPELLVGAAFAGGFLTAMILKRLG